MERKHVQCIASWCWSGGDFNTMEQRFDVLRCVLERSRMQVMQCTFLPWFHANPLIDRWWDEATKEEAQPYGGKSRHMFSPAAESVSLSSKLGALTFSLAEAHLQHYAVSNKYVTTWWGSAQFPLTFLNRMIFITHYYHQDQCWCVLLLNHRQWDHLITTPRWDHKQ